MERSATNRGDVKERKKQQYRDFTGSNQFKLLERGFKWMINIFHGLCSPLLFIAQTTDND